MGLIDRLANAPADEAIRNGLFAQAEFFKNSLFLTTKCLLGYKDLTWRTHGPLCAKLESTEKKKKLIVMPRGSFKSTVASVGFPIWLLLREPNIRILLDSELYTNSKNFLREIKGHLESERLSRLYGSFRNRACWNEGEIIIGQRQKARKEASITCSGIGAEKTGQHYDVVICDDLNSPSNSNTPENQNKVIEHYKYLQAILDPGGILAVIGTRYCANDVIGHILKKEVEIEREVKNP